MITLALWRNPSQCTTMPVVSGAPSRQKISSFLVHAAGSASVLSTLSS